MLPHNYTKFQFRAHEVWSLATQNWFYGIFPQSQAWAAPAIMFALIAVGTFLMVIK